MKAKIMITDMEKQVVKKSICAIEIHSFYKLTAFITSSELHWILFNFERDSHRFVILSYT